MLSALHLALSYLEQGLLERVIPTHLLSSTLKVHPQGHSLMPYLETSFDTTEFVLSH